MNRVARSRLVFRLYTIRLCEMIRLRQMLRATSSAAAGVNRRRSCDLMSYREHRSLGIIFLCTCETTALLFGRALQIDRPR